MSHQRPTVVGARPAHLTGAARLSLIALLAASLTGLAGPGLALAGASPSAAPADTAPPAAAAPTPKGLTGEVYAFLPYWEIDGSTDSYLRYDLLTTIALFAVYYDPAGNLDTSTLLGGGRAAFISTIVAHAHAAGVRVDLTVRPSSDTLTGSDAFFATGDGAAAAAQAATISHVVSQVKALGLDGINLDIESLRGTNFPAYGAFSAAMRTALRKVDGSARVTVSTNANVSGSGMAKAALQAGADRDFLMGYAYRSAGSSPGSISPLVNSTGGLSLTWSIAQYDEAGVPRAKVLLGLPYYGMTWPTTASGLHATKTGPGTAYFPTDDPPPPAGTSINHDALEGSAWFAVQDPTTKAWSETYFDDETTLRLKYGLAAQDGLAGVGIWALGYDQGVDGYWEAIASTFGVLRLGGSDRYGTAAAISADLLQPGAGTMVVASGLGFADGLAGAAAAGHIGGSLLLTGATTLAPAAAHELARVKPNSVLVLGSKAAISDAVIHAIQTTLPAATVTRVSGSDRYATSAALSATVYPDGASTVFVASGVNYPDGLAGGAQAARLGAPLLLSDPTELSPVTLTELQRLHPSTVYLLGSTAALSKAVASAITAKLPSATVTRLGGTDRYATAIAISKLQDPGVPVVYIASGAAFPDGLAGGAAAGQLGGPLLLTPPGGLTSAIGAELTRLHPRRIVVLGSSAAVSNTVVNQARGYLAVQ